MIHPLLLKGLAVLGLLVPLFIIDVPPLYDYLNRVAEAHLIGHPSPAYTVDWGIQPNLASAGVAWALGTWLDAYDIARVLLALSLVLPFAGVCLLHRVIHRQLGLWPLTASLVVYNGILGVGAFNYCIGQGIVLIGLSGWLHFTRWIRILVGVLAANILYFTHLMAFTAFALIIILHALSQRKLRDLIDVGFTISIPVFLILSVPTNFPSELTVYGSTIDKGRALLSPFVFIGYPWEFILAAILLVVLLWATRLKVATEFRLPILGLTAAALVTPSILNGVSAVDWRLPVLLTFLIIATTKPRPLNWLGVIIAGVFALKIGVITFHWQSQQSIFAEARKAMQMLPQGASIQSVGNVKSRQFPPYIHLVSLAVVERSAFVPTLFTYSGPVYASPGYRHLDRPGGAPVPPEKVDPRFDYLFWIHDGAEPTTPYEPIARGSFFTIFKTAS